MTRCSLPQVAQLSAALDAGARAGRAVRRGISRAVSPPARQAACRSQDIEKLQATSVMDAANIKVVAAQLAVMRAKLALTRDRRARSTASS